MSTAQKCISFGAQSLDSAVFNHIRTYDPGPRPLLRIIELDDGSIFDGDFGGDSIMQPAKEIQVTLMVKDATRTTATFNAAVQALRALGGTTATLTGEDIEGNTLTCTAKCDGVPLETLPRTFNHFWIEITLTFIPLDHWS